MKLKLFLIFQVKWSENPADLGGCLLHSLLNLNKQKTIKSQFSTPPRKRSIKNVPEKLRVLKRQRDKRNDKSLSKPFHSESVIDYTKPLGINT